MNDFQDIPQAHSYLNRNQRSLSEENLARYKSTDHNVDSHERRVKRYVDNYKQNGSMSKSYYMNTLVSSSDSGSPRRIPRVVDDDTRYFQEKIDKYRRKNKELRARLMISENEVERLKKEIKVEIHRRQEILNTKNKKPLGREKEIQNLREEIRYLENLIVNNNKASRVQWSLNQGVYTSNLHESLLKKTKDNIVLGKKVKNLLRDNSRFIEWRKLYRKDNLNWERERVELLNIIDRLELELIQKNDVNEVLRRNESRLTADLQSARMIEGIGSLKSSKLKYTEDEYQAVLDKLKKTEKKLRKAEGEYDELAAEAKEKQKSLQAKLQNARSEMEVLRQRPIEIQERIITTPPQIVEKLIGVSYEAHERKLLEFREEAERLTNEIERWKKITYELEERLRRQQADHDTEIIMLKRRFIV